MDGRYRQGYYGMPQSQSPWHDPFQKTPSWGRGISELIKNFMMMKQLKEERGEKEWERGFKEKEQERRFEHLGAQEELWEAYGERAGRPPTPREPTIPAEIQAAQIVAEQTGKSVGEILNAWKSRKPVKPEEPGIKKSRQKWLEGLDKAIDTMIKGIQARPEYGMDEELTGKVTNLQQAKTKIRGALLIGADQPLADTMWRDLGKISESLEQIQKVGLYPPEEKLTTTEELSRLGIKISGTMKASEVPPDADTRQLANMKIIAKIGDKYYYVIQDIE